MLDAGLGPVVGGEAEPHVGVGPREGRVGRAGEDGIDPQALLEQGECLFGDIAVDRLLGEPVAVGPLVGLDPRSGGLPVGSGEKVLDLLEILHPPEPGHRGDERDRATADELALGHHPLHEVTLGGEVDEHEPAGAVGDAGAGEDGVYRTGDRVDGGVDAGLVAQVHLDGLVHGVRNLGDIEDYHLRAELLGLLGGGGTHSGGASDDNHTLAVVAEDFVTHGSPFAGAGQAAAGAPEATTTEPMALSRWEAR